MFAHACKKEGDGKDVQILKSTLSVHDCRISKEVCSHQIEASRIQFKPQEIISDTCLNRQEAIQHIIIMYARKTDITRDMK